MSISPARRFALFFLVWPLLYFCYNALSYRANAFEADAYVAYAKSIVSDGDFNIVNNRSPELNWILSPTGNVPDMHDHGVAVIWLPAALVARTLEVFGIGTTASSRGEESVFVLCIFLISVLTLFFGLTRLKSFEVDVSTAAFFLLATPLFYYSLIEFTAADASCFMFSALLIAAYHSFNFKKSGDFFMWGALIGFSRVLKISFLFWWPLLFLLIGPHLRRNQPKKILNLIAGLSIILLVKIINDYIQFGQFSFFNGYDYDFLISRSDYFSNLWQNFVGPFGVVHQAPWLLIPLAGALLLITLPGADRLDRTLSFFILVALLSKFFYEGHAISAAETEYGFRRYVVDLPFVLWLATRLQTRMRPSFPNLLKFLTGLLSVAAAYNLVYFFWFRDIDKNHFSAFGVKTTADFIYIAQGFRDFLHLVYQLFCDSKFGFSFIAIGLFSLGFIFFYEAIVQISTRKAGMAVIGVYLALSAVNMINNTRNVSTMRLAGALDHKLVAKEFSLFVYDEAVSEFGRNLLISKYNKELEKFETTKEKLLLYFKSFEHAVQTDPIGFVNDLRQKKYRESVFYPGVSMEEMLNYSSQGLYERAFAAAVPKPAP